MMEESIDDLNSLSKLRPYKNPIKRKKEVKKPIAKLADNNIGDIKTRLDKLEEKVYRLEKLTKYLDYVRSINVNKK